jgi:hypothetical protein
VCVCVREICVCSNSASDGAGECVWVCGCGCAIVRRFHCELTHRSYALTYPSAITQIPTALVGQLIGPKGSNIQQLSATVS